MSVIITGENNQLTMVYRSSVKLKNGILGVKYIYITGNSRILTLTQVKRFTQEAVKILKALSDRKCFAHEYAGLYRELFKVNTIQK